MDISPWELHKIAELRESILDISRQTGESAVDVAKNMFDPLLWETEKGQMLMRTLEHHDSGSDENPEKPNLSLLGSL